MNEGGPTGSFYQSFVERMFRITCLNGDKTPFQGAKNWKYVPGNVLHHISQACIPDITIVLVRQDIHY